MTFPCFTVGRDLRIAESGGHGKACQGHKRTSTIQVREYGVVQGAYLLAKQFRFTVGDAVGRYKAMEKAIKFIRENKNKKGKTE